MSIDIVWWHWALQGILLLALELMVPGSFFLWLSVGSFVVSLALIFIADFSLTGQCILFVFSSFLSILGGRKWFKRHKTSIKNPLNNRAHSYIGQTFMLDTPILNGRGHLKIDDTLWSIEGSNMPQKTLVKVVQVHGMTLKVIQIKE